MTDNSLNDKIRAWLDADNPDPAAGADLLLSLSGNKIRHRNLIRRGAGALAFIRAELARYLEFRLRKMTREQVADLSVKAEKAMADADRPRGKRPDHDSLPDEIRALFDANLDILHRMRETHRQLRALSLDDAPCPDSEIYPFVTDLIRLDKLRLSNWARYDSWTPEQEEE